MTLNTHQILENIEWISGDSDVFDFARLLEFNEGRDRVREELLIRGAKLDVVKLDDVDVLHSQALQRLLNRLDRFL